MKSKIFYTDGACSGNPGIGGWACIEVIECSEGIKTEITSGGKIETTNNEMELTAAYTALVKSYKANVRKVTIYSDSAYVVNAIQKGWLMNWSRNGWLTKEGNSVKNKNIWEKVYKLIYKKFIEVKMVKVKGHNGDPLNELADRVAVEEKEKRQ